MKRIADDISKYGQHIVSVGQYADKTHPDYSEDFQPFAYTIGNHEKGLPELLYVGDIDDVYIQILNILGEMQRAQKKAFQHGEMIDYSAKFPARVIDAGLKGRKIYAFGVERYYNTEKFELLQVLLCDHNGKYPGEAGCLYTDAIVLTQTH